MNNIDEAIRHLEHSINTSQNMLIWATRGLPSAILEHMLNADIKAYKTAIQALEKQMPKKPQCEYDDECICPTCDKTIEDYDVRTIKYCPECGQKWDWEAKAK